MVRKQKKAAPNRSKSAARSSGKPTGNLGNRRSGASDGRQGTHRPSDRSPERSPERSPGRPSDRPSNQFRPKHSDSVFLYGRNSVEAALANPERECVRLFASERAASALDKALSERVAMLSMPGPEMFSGLIPADAPHQGLVLEVRPLPGQSIEDMQPLEGRKNIILMLDQVTDPQNVGACLRSAAAFGARALITQDRNSPMESGALARASAGGLEVTPWLRVANLAQTLEALREMGYWHVGLDGSTKQTLKQVSLGDNIVIVMGSEGKGLRPLVQKSCDMIAKIPMSGPIESLNVSNAAAIALYQLTQ